MDEAIPWGCGMMVRREVATQYHSSLSKDPSKQGLDRTGDSLNSCGDEQFSLVACEMGLGKGIFVDLDLVHLIGKQRVQKEYLLRLAEAHAFSKAMLMHIHGGKVPVQRSPPTWSKFFGHVLRLQLGMVFLEGTRLWDRRSREHVARGNSMMHDAPGLRASIGPCMVDHLVSIIMPAYQVGAFIGEALHSVATKLMWNGR
ncbi:MAG: hypothetical protein IPL64_09250 [Flavobacteriales bacterium]|nr:hypothetical protein [Flavobacteriales bacterium]